MVRFLGLGWQQACVYTVVDGLDARGELEIIAAAALDEVAVVVLSRAAKRIALACATRIELVTSW
jgi:hypothetical protein